MAIFTKEKMYIQTKYHDTTKNIIFKLVSSKNGLKNYILVYDMCVKHVYLSAMYNIIVNSLKQE